MGHLSELIIFLSSQLSGYISSPFNEYIKSLVRCMFMKLVDFICDWMHIKDIQKYTDQRN
jgi:hypothetical protein